MNTESRKLRSQIGVAMRLHPHDTEAIRDLRREFLTSRLAEQIKETLAADALTTEQRQRLATLLLAEVAA